MNKFTNLTASAQIKAGPGTAVGVIINSHSSGTLKLWNSLTAANAVLCETLTFAVGERFIPLYDANFNIGLYATIGGTANITIVYE